MMIYHAIEHDNWDGEPWGISWPSLSMVVSLAERCHKLESVNIEFWCVDASKLVRLEADAEASNMCASPRPELRRIVFEPYAGIRQRFRVADPSRLAAALRKLFPNLIGQLEKLEGVPGERPIALSRDWHPSEMDTDVPPLEGP